MDWAETKDDDPRYRRYAGRHRDVILAWVRSGSRAAEVLRFGLTGGTSTLIYIIATLLLSAAGLRVSLASVAGYAAGAVFSYAAHRTFTFVSDGAVGFEIPRFACATAAGLALSAVLALVLSDLAGLPPAVPVALATVLVPGMNFFILRRYVFQTRRSAP